MGSLFSQNRLMTVALAVVVIAGITRIPAAKDLLLNDSKFLGIF